MCIRDSPYTAGISNARPWFNYNKIRYYGLETALQYSDKIGALRFSVGGNATIQNSKILKFDQPNYRFDYQSRIGQPIDAYYGQTYLGKFASDAETQAVPQIYDETLKQGDLKYLDKNGDGVVDDNDQSQIGNTTPRLFYLSLIHIWYRGTAEAAKRRDDGRVFLEG